MREVYIGKTITLEKKLFEADEFYMVSDSLALVIVSSGCGCYADSDDEETTHEGETNESSINT